VCVLVLGSLMPVVVVVMSDHVAACVHADAGAVVVIDNPSASGGGGHTLWCVCAGTGVVIVIVASHHRDCLQHVCMLAQGSSLSL